MYMWHGFRFKKRGLIFLSLLFSLLISWIIIPSIFLNDTPLFSFSKVQKSIAGFRSRLNNAVDTFLARITVEKMVTDKATTNFSPTVDFVVVSPTVDIVLPTKSLFLRPTSVQSSFKPSKALVISLTRPPTRPTNPPSLPPTNILLPTKISPRIPSPTKSLAPQATTIPSPKVVSYKNPLGLPPPSSKIHDLAVEIGQKVGVPPALILTIMNIETGGTFYSRDNAYVEQYSKPGASMKNLWGECKINSCGAAGPMQMTVGYDSYNDTACSRCPYTVEHYIKKNLAPVCPANAWRGVSEQVKSFVGSSSVSPCNIRENMYGGVIKMKYDSTYVVAVTKYGGTIDTDCVPFIKDKPVVDGMKWNRKAVFLTGCHYYGACTIKYERLNNRTYCEYLWDALPSEHKIL